MQQHRRSLCPPHTVMSIYIPFPTVIPRAHCPPLGRQRQTAVGLALHRQLEAQAQYRRQVGRQGVLPLSSPLRSRLQITPYSHPVALLSPISFQIADLNFMTLAARDKRDTRSGDCEPPGARVPLRPRAPPSPSPEQDEPRLLPPRIPCSCGVRPPGRT